LWKLDPFHGAVFTLSVYPVLSVPAKQKSRGRPATGTDPMVGFRLPIGVIQAIDKAAKADRTTRSGIARAILTDWLKAKGYLKDD